MTFPDIQEEKVPFTSRVEGKDICGPVLHTSKESGGLFTSRGPEREYTALNLRVFMNVVWNRFNLIVLTASKTPTLTTPSQARL